MIDKETAIRDLMFRDENRFYQQHFPEPRPVAEVLAAVRGYSEPVKGRIYNPSEGMCHALEDAETLGIISAAEKQSAMIAIKQFLHKLAMRIGYQGEYLDEYITSMSCYDVYEKWEERHERAVPLDSSDLW